ncbi:MAG: DNA polymerase III subunit delta [Bacteroidia bacterium]|nr:DNA polymerase III subunit delta [Bacteroidia bacterium]
MIWILYGEDEFRRTQRRKALIDELLQGLPADFALTIWRGKTFGESTFPQLYEPPFLAPYKVVLLLEAETLGVAELKLLEHYLQNPAPTTRLILEFSQADKPKLPAGSAISYESFSSLRPKEVVDWVLNQAERWGLSLPPESAALLVEVLGSDLRLLYQTLELLSLYRGQDGAVPLTPDEVAEALGLSPQYTPYKLTEALADGDKGKALQVGAAFAEDVRNYPLAQVMGHLRVFYQNVARLHLTRTPPITRAIQDRLGLRFPFQAKVYERAMRHIPLDRCLKSLQLLRETEARQKGILPSRQRDGQLILGLIQKLVG